MSENGPEPEDAGDEEGIPADAVEAHEAIEFQLAVDVDEAIERAQQEWVDFKDVISW